MTVSWESALALASTSATLSVVATNNHLPVWILAWIWFVWGLISLVNSDKIDIRSSITFLVSWASTSAFATNIIIDKAFGSTDYWTELSIWIAFVLGIIWHLLIGKIIARKEEIIDKAITAGIKKINPLKDDK